MSKLLRLAPQEAVLAEILTQEAVDRVLFLDKTLPRVEGHSSILKIELTNFVGDEVVRLIGEAKNLQQRYVDLIHQRDQLWGLENRDALIKVQANISAVTRQLSDATRALGRNLESKTDIPDNVAKFFGERAHVINLLTDLYDELKVEMSFTSFAAAVDADKQELDLLAQAQEREKSISDIVAGLEAEIALEEEERQRDEAAFQTEVGELVRELQRIQTVSSIDLVYEEARSKETQAQVALSVKVKIAAMQNQLEKIRDEAEKAKTADRMTSAFFAEFLEKLHQLKSHWSLKYESSLKDMEIADAELARKRKPVIEELTILRERKAAEDALLDAERLKLEQEDEIEQKRIDQRVNEIEAISLIQKIGRRYISQLKEKPVKKKKGKKSKK